MAFFFPTAGNKHTAIAAKEYLDRKKPPKHQSWIGERSDLSLIPAVWDFWGYFAAK